MLKLTNSVDLQEAFLEVFGKFWENDQVRLFIYVNLHHTIDENCEWVYIPMIYPENRYKFKKLNIRKNCVFRNNESVIEEKI